MIKSNNQSPERQPNKQKELARKNQRIKELLTLIQHSQKRQAELLKAISQEKSSIEERENTLVSKGSYSLVDLDIRNSQLVSSLELERKRWLQDRPRQSVAVLGQEQELKHKISQIKQEEKPAEKTKMLKLMKRKQQLLQNLSKIKPDSGLSTSHQRVMLVKYLEDIRVLNAELEQSNRKYGKLELEYGQAERKLRNTVNDLRTAIPAKDGQEVLT